METNHCTRDGEIITGFLIKRQVRFGTGNVNDKPSDLIYAGGSSR
jgi:hypothetical protein